MRPTDERAVVVADPGLLSTIQDLGRVGRAASGVSPAGAVDTFSARAANLLVGNPADAALIETTMTGIALDAEGPLRIAVTGADAELTIGGRARSGWRTHRVHRGERIGIGIARTGVRSYVAIEGGIAVERVLGSSSTDVGAGIGGRVLAPGDRLAMGPVAPRSAPAVDLAYPAWAVPDLGSGAVLRAMPAFGADVLGENALESFFSNSYRGSARSGRQALRLEGPPVPSARDADPISSGVCAGCVQITRDGLPLVLLGEHQTTGGYPVLLCVISADVARAAQVRPGDGVRFARASYRDAVEAHNAASKRLRALGPVCSGDEQRTGDDARLSAGFFEGA
jgi:biotin-dependent carboxylase-like uncharacterized protein